MNAIITDKWYNFLEKFNAVKLDVYYCEEYVKLYETIDSKALCAVCYEDAKVLIMPFIRREINGWYDFETAYGYGGPISNTEDIAWNQAALEEMRLLFEKERYVCGFIRFHPLLKNNLLCSNKIQTLFDRNTVAIVTSKPEEDIWTSQITSKNRNMIRKAEKNGLVYKAEYDFESMSEFVQLYKETMERLGADEFYFFNLEYYKKFAEQFTGKAFLGTVRKGNELICAALFMYSKYYGHYHLEGSNFAYSSLGANNLLLWKTALEFHKLGVREFHLGGGYNSAPDNSLLKFKKAFSNNLNEFYIGKWIFNPDKYSEIKARWAENNPDKVNQYGSFLLCYRF